MSGQQVVWKYPLDLAYEVQSVEMPAQAEVVHIAWQDGRPTLWCLVQQREVMTTRRYQVAGTGQDVPPAPALIYKGTVPSPGGFVWHIFEVLDGGAR